MARYRIVHWREIPSLVEAFEGDQVARLGGGRVLPGDRLAVTEPPAGWSAIGRIASMVPCRAVERIPLVKREVPRTKKLRSSTPRTRPSRNWSTIIAG